MKWGKVLRHIPFSKPLHPNASLPPIAQKEKAEGDRWRGEQAGDKFNLILMQAPQRSTGSDMFWVILVSAKRYLATNSERDKCFALCSCAFTSQGLLLERSYLLHILKHAKLKDRFKVRMPPHFKRSKQTCHGANPQDRQRFSFLRSFIVEGKNLLRSGTQTLMRVNLDEKPAVEHHVLKLQIDTSHHRTFSQDRVYPFNN